MPELDLVTLAKIAIVIILLGVLIALAVTFVSSVSEIGVLGGAALSDTVDHFGTPHWLTTRHLITEWFDGCYPDLFSDFMLWVSLVPGALMAYVVVVVARKLLM